MSCCTTHRLGFKPIHGCKFERTLRAVSKQCVNKVINLTVANSSAFLEQNGIAPRTQIPVKTTRIFARWQT